jgi:hypothetical protein
MSTVERVANLLKSKEYEARAQEEQDRHARQVLDAVAQEFRRRAEEAELSDQAKGGLSSRGHQDASEERPGPKPIPVAEVDQGPLW